MPDGQILSPVSFTPATAAYLLRNTELLARNALLQSALDRQRTKSEDLRSILCSLDIATVCVSRDLKLRLLTAAAGRLLGIGPGDVGSNLSLTGQFGHCGTLTERMQAVLCSGIAEEDIVRMASGRVLMCRMLPLRAGGAAEAVDGLILIFSTTDRTIDDALVDLPDHNHDASAGHDDGGLAAGYPNLACGLTRRQHQVLGHVLAGHPSKNIAADLGISRRTVENHRAAIMARTGATSLPALARLAIGADVGGDCRPAPAPCGSE